MEDCLFCMIAEGKIPSKKLYEDEQVVAFYDINPQAKVHFLVVPKKHIVSAVVLTEEDGALLGHIFAVIAKLAAEQGDKVSQFQIGLMYQTGLGVEADPEEAHRWFTAHRKHHMHHAQTPQMQAWREQVTAQLVDQVDNGRF